MEREFYSRYWQDRAPAPDRDPTTPERKAKLRKVLSGLGLGLRCLDYGCGRGDFAAMMGEDGHQAFGVDLAEPAVAAARERHPGVRFEVLGEQGKIPFDDALFDCVWSSEVLEHIFDVHSHLSELNRVMKHNGVLVLTTPYHGVLKNVVLALWKFDRHFDPACSHIRFFDRRSLQRVLERAGFEVEAWSGIGRLRYLYRSFFVVARKQRAPEPWVPIDG